MERAADGSLPLHSAASISTLEVVQKLTTLRPEALWATTTRWKWKLPVDCARHNVTNPEVAQWLELAMSDMYEEENRRPATEEATAAAEFRLDTKFPR
jgi:hypothetical protein